MNLPEPELGRIEWLDIREIWTHEAADFTPWLLENVDALSEALGLELQLERAEHPVGGFSLDLIGRDLTHGARLIVENQIEQSDHAHLGQLLTYAAGTDAATIAWVARSFRDEHRVALDWLNEQTGEGIRFFGIVVRALKIDGSRPAPHFEVVAKPNDWQKSVRKTTSVGDSSQHEAYRAFWKPVREAVLQKTPALLAGRAEPRSLWLTMNSAIPRTSIQAEIGAREIRIILEVDTGDRAANLALLERLREHRTLLEADGGSLEFLEGNHRCRIIRRRPWEGKLLTQPERHDEARDWFGEQLLALRRGTENVAPLLRALNEPRPVDLGFRLAVLTRDV